jgi:hypothetical protein
MKEDQRNFISPKQSWDLRDCGDEKLDETIQSRWYSLRIPEQTKATARRPSKNP